MTKRREGPDWIERAAQAGALPWRAAPWTEKAAPHPPSPPSSRRSLPPASRPPASRPPGSRPPASLRSVPPPIAPELLEAQAELASARATVTSLEEALAHAHAEADALRGAIAQQSAELADRREANERDLEEKLFALAVAVARRIVARELAAEPALVVAWAREAIAGAKLGEETRVVIAADVGEGVPAEAWGALAERVTVDPALAPGACVLHDGARVVAAGAEARLEALAEHIAGAADAAGAAGDANEKRAA